MAVFRVEKNRDYTVMANFHLKDSGLSLKAKGLLSLILSLPDNWNYTIRGLAAICMEGVDSIGGALRELERAGYILRSQLRDKKGRITDTEYVIYERPQKPDTPSPDTGYPDTGFPDMDNPATAKPDTENPAQLNTNKANIRRSNTYPIQSYQSGGMDGMGLDTAMEYREIIKENIQYGVCYRMDHAALGA